MKKIKVKTLFGSHPIYQEIVNYPPKGVKYIGFGKEIVSGAYYKKKKVKERISRILQKLNLPRMIYLPKISADLIHSSRGILILNKKPWILDLEHATSFVGLNPLVWKKEFPKKIVKTFLSSKYCKKIIPHCEASKKSLLNSLDCAKFKDKTETVYPATHIQKYIKRFKNKKQNDKIKLLFVSSLFELKGGLYLLEAFKRLIKDYDNLELTIKSDVHSEIKKKFQLKNINFFPYLSEILPREELIKRYHMNSNIFIYPTLFDSFGYGLLDAMVAGLPIIASNLFAVPEIVQDNKMGFIVKIPSYKLYKGYERHKIIKKKKDKEKFTNELTKKLKILIEDSGLRKRMGKAARKEVESGKFSIEERNKKLRRIYEEALK